MSRLFLFITLTTWVAAMFTLCAGAPQFTTIPSSVGGFGIVANPSGKIAFVSTVNSVTKLTQNSGSWSVAPSVQLLGSNLKYAAGLAINSAGNIFVADIGSGNVQSLNPNTGSAVAGFSPVSGVSSPGAVAVYNNVLYVLGAAGIYTVSASAGGAASASPALSLSQMSLGATSGNSDSWLSLCLDSQKLFLYYADYTTGVLYRSHVSTTGVLSVDSGFKVTGFGNPNSCAVAADGTVVVADYTGNRILEVPSGVTTGSATQVPTLTHATHSSINAPGGVSLDSSGELFIAETASGASHVDFVTGLNL